MGKHLQQLVWALAGAAATVAIAATFGIATGEPGRPAPAAPPPTGASRGALVPVQGTVARKDAAGAMVELETPQGKASVHLAPGVRILKQVRATLADIKEKDFVTVLGVPRALDARSINVFPAGEGTVPAPGAGQPAAPDPLMPRPAAWGSASGVVVSLNPLTLEVDKARVTVAVDEETPILRRTPATLDEIPVGELMMAWGEWDAQKVLQARSVFVGQQGAPGGPRRGPSGAGAAPGEAPAR